MSLTVLLLLSLSLAMDCFSVSVVSGAILQSFHGRVILRTSLLFGIFQALMPFLGWAAVSLFAASIAHYGHWIAFALLLFIGGKMIVESLSNDDGHQSFNPRQLKTQLLLAVATSIDALAVGVSMAVTGYTSLSQLPQPLAVIGITSLLLSWAGYLLGIRFGHHIAKVIRPELFGGIILVALAFKTLLT